MSALKGSQAFNNKHVMFAKMVTKGCNVEWLGTARDDRAVWFNAKKRIVESIHGTFAFSCTLFEIFF